MVGVNRLRCKHAERPRDLLRSRFHPGSREIHHVRLELPVFWIPIAPRVNGTRSRAREGLRRQSKAALTDVSSRPPETKGTRLISRSRLTAFDVSLPGLSPQRFSVINGRLHRKQSTEEGAGDIERVVQEGLQVDPCQNLDCPFMI